MKKVLHLTYNIILIFIIIASALCEEEVDVVDDAKETGDVPHSLYYERNDKMDVEEEDMINPHSFYYDRVNKIMIKEESTYFGEDVLVEQDTEQNEHSDKCESTDKHCTHERIFYKRLINLLLSNINIQGDDDEHITGTLRIEASSSQMELLQNIDIEKTSLRELDAVLSDIIKKPKYDYIAKIGSFLDFMATVFKWTVETIMENSQECVIFLIVVVTLIATTITCQKGLPILAIIEVIFVISFFMTWWQLLQEEQVKMRVAQMQFAEIPIACQPDKMNLWHKISASLFSNNDCEKYYETVMSNPQFKVTPALALTHFVTTIILHPVTNIGHVISIFVDNATGNLSIFYGWIVKILIFSSICVVIILLPFCLFGTSINFGLGPLFQFGINSHERNKSNRSLQDSAKREPLQIILQVPHHANVQALTNISEDNQTQMIELKKIEMKDDSQEKKERMNVDLSSGDKAEEDGRREEERIVKLKEEVGSGDN